MRHWGGAGIGDEQRSDECANRRFLESVPEIAEGTLEVAANFAGRLRRVGDRRGLVDDRFEHVLGCRPMAIHGGSGHPGSLVDSMWCQTGETLLAQEFESSGHDGICRVT